MEQIPSPPTSKSARQDCFFCSAIKNDSKNLTTIPELSQGIFVVAFDGYPTTPGHVIILPKRHAQYMQELRHEETTQLIHTVTQTKEYLKKADLLLAYNQMAVTAKGTKAEIYVNHARERIESFNRPPDSFNDGINDGPAAGQTISHFHWHIMPRWYGDVEDPRGGIRGMFMGLGNYHTGTIVGSM